MIVVKPEGKAEGLSLVLSTRLAHTELEALEVAFGEEKCELLGEWSGSKVPIAKLTLRSKPSTKSIPVTPGYYALVKEGWRHPEMYRLSPSGGWASVASGMLVLVDAELFEGAQFAGPFFT